MRNPDLIAGLPFGRVLESLGLGDEDAAVGFKGRHAGSASGWVCDRHGGVFERPEVDVAHSGEFVLQEVPRVQAFLFGLEVLEAYPADLIVVIVDEHPFQLHPLIEGKVRMVFEW